MTTWITPGQHINKAAEYATKADDMATTGGINVETMSRLNTLARLAQVHVDLAMAKRST